MEPDRQCMICGLPVNNGAWLCIACERAYGLAIAFAGWPDWAKALKDDEQKRRRRIARYRGFTVLSYEEAGIEDLVYSGADDSLAG